LKDYEEKYYNMLKEIAKNALEDDEVEVLAYLYDIIRNFEHYFCTLDEDNVSRETSSQ
jgi:predicted house-cleaning noncanonical NTP pyrophosphatase (MazG superfamily)